MTDAITPLRLARPDSLPDPTATYVVVEASAGTGKTYFLEHRVIDLVLAGAHLGEILLVTFTEKAVAELRLRVRDLLDRLARAEASTAAPDAARCWILDDDARRKLRAAVAEFDHAPIYTIHGFCQRILVEDAFAATRLFDQTQVADEVAFDAAFTALVRERFARTEPQRDLLRAYLASGKRLDRLRDVLLACARAGEGARVQRALDPAAVTAAATAIHAALATPEQREAVLAPVTHGNHRKWMSDWLETVAERIEELAPPVSPPDALAVITALQPELGKLAGYVERQPATAALASVLRTGLGLGTLEEAIVAELLPTVMDRVASDKAEQGLFDYDDMLRLVGRALRGPRGPELASRLRARTPWAMIDEFQDTDAVQWGIFRDVWVHAEAKGLCIVGDPKQAIYGFRGADVQTYLAAREELLAAGAERVTLDVNRRSTAALVDAVNLILAGSPLAPLLTGAITYDAPVRASGDIVAAAGEPAIEIFELASGKSDTEGVKAAVARAIGDGIEALCVAAPVWTARGVARPFGIGDVMVLTRTNRDSLEIAAALRARGLSCALVEPERLFETREAAELADVLGAIAAPRDRSARMRALRTRFFDVPWTELVRVVDAPDHHPVIARIFEWSHLAGRRAYERLFRQLVEDSRYAERALVLGAGERALTNTWHLIELVLAEVARSRSDLHELVSQLRRWMTDETSRPDERDVQRAETDAEAIRILTIHKAKGLEAPYVFLYGGGGSPPPFKVSTLRDATGRVLVVGAPDAATAPALEQATAEENQRLAYVALTRAQVRLYLPVYAELRSKAAYEPIQRCLKPLATAAGAGAAAGASPHGDLLVTRIEVGTTALPDAPLDALATLVATAPPVMSELEPLAGARAGLVTLSYTRLARDLDQVIAVDARTLVEAAELHGEDDSDAMPPPVSEPPGAAQPAAVAEAAAAGELPGGADSGLLLHDILEQADLALARTAPDAAAWASDPRVMQQVADAARARGIGARYLEHATRLAHAALVNPLALADGRELPPLIAADALAREVEFSYPLPAGGGLVRGFIDVLVAWGDELWVLDYKSDVLAPDARGSRVAAARARVDEHYQVQARLYALAADRLRGRRRLAGLLFAFVRYGIVVPEPVSMDALVGYGSWLGALPIVREVSP